MRCFICYITLGFLLLTRVCNAQNASLQDYAMNDLQKLQLNAQNLDNYEQQAIQKLQDVLDYMSIIGSNKYNKTMRETALKSALGCFVQKAKINCDWMESLDQQKPTKLNKKGEIPECLAAKMLKDLLEANYYETQVAYKNIKIDKQLQQQSQEGIYQGALYYEIEFKIKERKETNKFKDFRWKLGKMNFVLKRVKKKFGNENELIWEVQFTGLPN